MEEKSTLWLYRMNKREMSEEDYGGGEEDTVLFRARTNCLWLGDKNRQEGEQLCKICGGGMREDLEHFLLECCELEGVRWGATELRRPRWGESSEVMGKFLFDRRDAAEKKGVLREMWRVRRRIERSRE